MQNSFFKSIENKTGVSMDDLFTLANAISHADFTDDKQVRKIVRKVGKLANKPVSQELEDELTRSILQSGSSLSLADIQKLL
ncbi:Stage VI sporulation protein F [Psychrobacillus psychrotolerans]|uniref:Stage VI sporulation protein F n=1 Tax=Psychrobacillus psychrotolerans TaxID=126156 RepID=A0A1I5WUH9_9BACI|nr:stage VI sporulation protein F [Psychrobacillus psychrotolerans]SFQ23268.1 Stage VI sporulation protein F [Psychrobacillus psychrotolerans]